MNRNKNNSTLKVLYVLLIFSFVFLMYLIILYALFNGLLKNIEVTASPSGIVISGEFYEEVYQHE